MSRLLLRVSLLLLFTLLTLGPEISSCLSSSKFERNDEDLRYGDEGDRDDRGKDAEDRQLPGIPPEVNQVFWKMLMSPLTIAASLLPVHNGGDRNDHQADEGHVRHDIGKVADATRNQDVARIEKQPQGEDRVKIYPTANG